MRKTDESVLTRPTEKKNVGRKINRTLDALDTILAPEMPSQWGFGALYSRGGHAPIPTRSRSRVLNPRLLPFPHFTGPQCLIPPWFPTTAVPKALRCPRFSSSIVLILVRRYYPDLFTDLPFGARCVVINMIRFIGGVCRQSSWRIDKLTLEEDKSKDVAYIFFFYCIFYYIFFFYLYMTRKLTLSIYN